MPALPCLEMRSPLFPPALLPKEYIAESRAHTDERG
jgi:hypothetical protein